MQNKGAITLLAILLLLASIYQLSFTFVTSSVENDAKKYAKGDFKKELAYLDSMSSEIVYPILNYTLRDCQKREINLGLDLKGGMNVTLEISVVDVLKALSNYNKDTTFTGAITLTKRMQQDSQEDFITLFGQAFKQIDPNARLAAIFATYENKGLIDATTSDEEVLAFIRRETSSAIDNSFEVLRNRIDRFGVAQPNIQRLKTTDRILIELPGIKDPERVRNLLQGTASLEFWETYENADVYQYLLEANEVIKNLNIVEDTLKTDDLSNTEDTLLVEDARESEEIELVSLMKNDTAQSDTTKKISLLEQLESDTTATDTSLSAEQWINDYPLFAVLRPSLSNDGQLYPGPAIGMTHYKDTAKVNKFLALKKVKTVFPKDIKFYWTYKPIKNKQERTFTDFYQLIAVKVTSRDGRPPLDGKVITNARAVFGQNQAVAEVSMQMNGEGASIWAKLTKQNIGHAIAIVLDGYVYSFPNVNSEIKGGSSSITGGFSIEEAQDLANVLKSGKLPAPARIIEEAIVGPSLGEEAIGSGLMSFIIAFVFVLLYMIFYYSRRAGLVADIALIVNLFLIFGVLASLQAVLTLPGIAGIILTIGMSVDANVLIYERIKEELLGGKGIKLAVADGYKNAYSAIIDANVTTLLTGVILYIFGTGPIKGFATTLVIGIITSLFSAIFITRLIFVYLLDKNKKLTFSTKLTKNAFKNLNIKFIEKRKIFYVISAIVIVAGIGSLFTRGLNYGIDFTGGRTFVVRFDEKISTTEITKALQVVFDKSVEVKKFGTDNQVKIATKYMIDSDDPNADQIVEAKLFEGLKHIIGNDIDIETFLSEHRMSSQKVGPTIADDIKVAAIWAIGLSLLFIFLYILLRFKNWQFGLGAVAALIHDVLLVLGVFSLLYSVMPFSMEIDQAFIAAILTVVGYSINDTVVVFDRIREYIALYKKRNRTEIINSALNSTISRTVSTSLSTFVVVLAVFIFGGEVIRGFTFALLIGIVVGTYSSLFIATPIVFDTIKKDETTRVLKGRRKY